VRVSPVRTRRGTLMDVMRRSDATQAKGCGGHILDSMPRPSIYWCV